jgi:hypothetical protein
MLLQNLNITSSDLVELLRKGSVRIVPYCGEDIEITVDDDQSVGLKFLDDDEESRI